MYTGVHRFLTFELPVNPPSSGTLAFSLRLAPSLPAADSPAFHTGSLASLSPARSQFPGTCSATFPLYRLLRHSGFLTSPHAFPACNKRSFTSLRFLLSFTDHPSVAWAHLFQLPTAPRLLLCTSTVTKPRTLGGNESWAAHRAGTTDRPRTSGSLPRPSRRDPVCERWRFLNRGRDGRGRANARDNMAAPKNNRGPVKRLTRYSGQPGIPKINTATKSDKGSNRYSGQP